MVPFFQEALPKPDKHLATTDAPVESQARDEFKRELAQAFVSGEGRHGESLECQPVRQHERTLELIRGGFGFSR